MLIWSININILSLSNMVSPNWDVERVKDFCLVVGLSCDDGERRILWGGMNWLI